MSLIVVPFLVMIISSGLSKKLPDSIDLCHKSDPQFAECFRKGITRAYEVFKHGNPSLGFPNLEPFAIKEMDLSNSQSSSTLKQSYRNIRVFGITESVVDRVEADFKGDYCYFRFNATTKVLRIESDYKLTGNVLIMPINGQGKSNITFWDTLVFHDVTCERFTAPRKNSVHLRVTDYKMSMRPRRVNFVFDNIIPGNEQMSTEVVKTLNENALSVFGEIKGGLEEGMSRVYKAVYNNFFVKVAEDNLFLP